MNQDRFFKITPKQELPKSVTDFAQRLKNIPLNANEAVYKLPEGYQESEVVLTAHEAFAYLSTVYLHSLVIIHHLEAHDEIIPRKEFEKFTSLGIILDDLIEGTTDRLKAESIQDDLEVPTFVREQIHIFLAIDRMARQLATHRMKQGRVEKKINEKFKNRLAAYAKSIPPVPTAFQHLIPFNLLEY